MRGAAPGGATRPPRWWVSLWAALCLLVAAPAAALIVSDDFSDPSGVLQPQWTLIDPIGDATFQIVGVGTGDAQLSISVPGGVTHNAWTNGLEVPRVVQAIPDADFEFEVKFDSALADKFETQGFVFEDGTGDFIRFDVYGRSNKTYAFAATLLGGNATVHKKKRIATTPTEPIYLQVQRVGDSWSYRYSWDGQVWIDLVTFVQPFNVATVGIYAGNAGPTPPHTALVDYVFDTSNPVVPEDDGLEICGYAVNVTVIGDGAVDVVPDEPLYDCDDVVTLTAVPGVDQTFNGWTGDITGFTNPVVVTMTDDVNVTAEFLSVFDPPAISNVQVLPLIDSARITWNTNEPATSRVDYGPSPGYEDGFVEDPTLKTQHFIELTGLTPNATYHYQVTSEDIDTLSSSTPDATFVTLPIGADASGIVSDDFSSGVLEPQWTLIDPVGDVTVDFVGGGTPDAHLRMTLPAGVEHQPWSGGNTAPRIMQPVNDVDFEFQTKIESPLGAGTYQGQGILVEESPGNYIRVEFYGTQGSLHVFAATLVSDSPTTQFDVVVPNTTPHWLRLTRVGDLWTVATSADGTNFSTEGSFTHAITATSVGVFASNSGTPPPAHTALFDYAFSTLSPVAPEDGFEPCFHTLTLATAGGVGTVTATPDKPTYDCNEQVTIEAIPAGNQLFDGWSGDAGGLTNPLVLNMTGNLSITANFIPIPTPPVISNILVAPGVDSSTITWETDEPATSRVDYGTAPGVLNLNVESTQLVTLHAVQLSGLAPDTLHYFTVTSENAAMLSSTSTELSFGTLPLGSDPSGIDSDDFSRDNLDTGLWSYSDPGDDTSLRVLGVGSSDATLDLELAAGAAQALDGSSDTAPRLVQPANNVDFSLEAKFESTPSADGQRQGLLVEGSGVRLRFDLSHDGTGLRAGAASLDTGGATVLLDVSAPSAPELWLRLERLANTWTLLHSTNGTSFTSAGSFGQTIVVGGVGLFAANAGGGGAAPAFTASIDSFENDADPIGSEDGSVAPDGLPPLVHAVSSTVTDVSAEIRWTTDEPGTSTVRYGTTTAYELGTIDDPTLVHDHVVTVPGLLPDTLYHVGIVSEDGLAQQTAAPDLLVLTAPPPAGPGPTIDLFYGSIQNYGDIGTPQPYANVLGNVTDPDGVATLTYELNGGAPQTLSMGPDDRRLPDLGDFNADIPTGNLVQGANTVLIRATDTLANESTRTVVVNYTDVNTWPENYSIDWSTVSKIHDVAQPVDGSWTISNGTLQNQQLAYDRLMAIGDQTWDEVEVEVPITVHSIDAGGFDPPSNQPGIGIILRWPGHTQRSGEQPFIEFQPVGAIGWVVFTPGGGNKLQIFPSSGGIVNNNNVPNLQFGTTYIFKYRVEQVVGVGGLYRFKMWEQGTAEPPDWQVEKQQTLSDPQAGSALLVAHHVDADFGNVTVRQLGNLSPVASDESYNTVEDVALNVSAAQGVLANDTDPENDPLEARLLTDVSSGTLVLNTDGSFTYTPGVEFSGQDSFTYEAFDGRSPSNPATVTIDVSFVDDAPIAVDDSYGGPENTVLSVNAASGVLANDSDPELATLAAQLETDVSSGSLSLASDGSFIYVPGPGFAGQDSFTYRASDGGQLSNVATVTILIEDPPTANDDFYATDEDVQLVVSAANGVLDNDVDPQLDPLLAQLVTGPSDGLLSLASDGSFTYTPDPDFAGADSFTYLATDGGNPSNVATVQITVNAFDDPPTAVDDEYEVEPDTPIVVSALEGVLANDSDPEMATLSAVLVQDVTDGLLALAPDGSFTYTPDLGFSGVDSFTYQADDGGLLSNVAMVTINVAVTLNTGLVAYWPLDAGSGTVAGDASGNGNDGSIVGPAWTTETQDGSAHALDFDGSDDFVDVGNLDVGGQGLTLALWMTADDWGTSDARLLSKADGTASEDHYWMLSTVKSSGRRLRARLMTGGATSTLVASGATLTLGDWYHAALTYDGAFLRIYQDGVEVDALAKTGDLDVNPAVFAAIGNQALGAGDKPFDGVLDDVRIYDRALSPAELTHLAALPPPPPDLNAPTAPAAVFAVPLSTSEVEVSWSDGNDDVGVASYRVSRDGLEVASGVTETQYVDSGLVAASSYSYTVEAEDAAGNLSPPTAGANAQTLAAGAPTWFDPAFEYRMAVSVPSGGTTRVSRPATVSLDFTTELAGVGQTGALDLNSLRVVRANTSGQVLDAAVPFQFDPGAGFDAATNAVGELVVLLEGTALAADQRRYDVYFDVVGEGFTPANVPSQVTVTAGVPDEGQLSYQVATQAGSYFFQEQGAALSSLVDGLGNDWIDYHIGGGSAGEFRGIPNLIFPESEFHPGGNDGITSVVNQGPLRLHLNAVTSDLLWEANWYFYPEHVTVTLEQNGHDFWFLYEGTPGGLLETGTDFMVRSDGTQTLLGESWNQDLVTEEWVYFHDPAAGSFFLGAHQDDLLADSYRPLNGEMTVFGFGRSGNSKLLNSSPLTFSMGLFDSPHVDVAGKRIRSVLEDLTASAGSIEQAP